MEETSPEPASKGFDISLKLISITLGIFLGHIAAFIIALIAGWIDFC